MKKTQENQPFLPFALPDIGEEEINEVVAALRSGWLTTGPRAKRFESDFAGFLGGGLHALAVNSATAGLHLALEALGIRDGDEVITTDYTFTATAEVVRYLGAKPVFVDIDPDTLNMDCRLLEAALTPRTKAIIPVHLGGLACDMDAVTAFARKHYLKVLEDAAHALPTTYKGRLVGIQPSAATVFSFYATKTITTGEGGMLVTPDADLARRAAVMRLHGISHDAFDRYAAQKPSWRYEVIAPGFKYNMTDIAAALGIHQLRKAWEFQKKRARMAAAYDEAFRDLPLILPPRAPAGDIHAWHLYVIRLRDEAGIPRDMFIERMAEQGIGCSVHFIPLHLHPVWRDGYNLKPEMFPHSQRAFEAAVSLPIYTKMTEADQGRVIETVRRILPRK